eukprot:COSAG01_NODE_2854_length_6967_cov_27.753058_5_plen_34_part_00
MSYATYYIDYNMSVTSVSVIYLFLDYTFYLAEL